MVKEMQGNLFDADAEAIVNAVNTVGVMGKGLALQFRKKFPTDYFDNYKIACQERSLIVGKIQVYEFQTSENPKYVLNFPTKKHWRESSKIEYINKGLVDMDKILERYQIGSVAMPALGCGLGGLDWNTVKNLVEQKFKDRINVDILLFSPM